MRDDAILALVEARGRYHDHLALGLRQIAGLVHQRVVIGEKGAELVGSVRQRQEHVRDEPRFLLHRENALANVVGHVGQGGNREAADGLGVAHAPRKTERP